MFSSHLHYLTSRKLPAFITNEKPVSIGFVSLSYRTARKIRKRTLFYEPFPRVPPFYCERCGLASSRSRILVEHDCSKKFPYSDYANLPKLIEMAHRSRVKDALGVMERLPDPQKYDVKPAPIFSSLDLGPEVTGRNPQRLK
ncbi:hypothetical protein AAVH_09582 [Aphelenchoides avenae]|nr:hypothetical protein AAVH_27878 [Aphelenchus avenae]KAH7712272.1 hypothetical protein AAVH_20401 [Aphelenchus avenae]KAH7719739.1 hypothetical protein AAVH_12774 [Aphelenchus avenae]KAH7719975.1 hypothetical protein AAVH_12618 [Aphelenchus avenae]KAH7722926.1 hypothetical protein AAVH_09582 [Aphelenchus avenae]